MEDLFDIGNDKVFKYRVSPLLPPFAQCLRQELLMPVVVTERLVSAVEPYRTPTGILLARASVCDTLRERREVWATPTDNAALGSH